MNPTTASSGLPLHYRLADFRYGDGDLRLEVQVFHPIKETDCGYWVVTEWEAQHDWSRPKPRWVSKTSTRRYCYPSLEEALNSYKIRKHRQVMHLAHQLDRATDARNGVEKMGLGTLQTMLERRESTQLHSESFSLL